MYYINFCFGRKRNRLILNLIENFSAEKGRVRFWLKSESTYFKFGRKVNRPKTEEYVFGRKRPRPY
jgi:hypothetical protein